MPSPDRKQRGRSGASEGTRARILDAARDLAVEEGFGAFTVDKVAERAGVSRMTVYYQFGSKPVLIEALLDHLAARGRMHLLGEAFREPDPIQALDRFVEVFCGFWASDPVGIRRLRSWAALEPGLAGSPDERDAWQRRGLEVLVGRLAKDRGAPVGAEADDVIDTLHTLLSAESYERLARGRSAPEVVALLKRMARVVAGVGPPR